MDDFSVQELFERNAETRNKRKSFLESTKSLKTILTFERTGLIELHRDSEKKRNYWKMYLNFYPVLYRGLPFFQPTPGLG